MKCAECPSYACRVGNMDRVPDNCPIPAEKEVFEAARRMYDQPEDNRIAAAAARTEAAGYGVWPRVVEIVEFCRRTGFCKIGMAFCVGLRQEARVLKQVWEAAGLTVVSANCKTGAVPKEELGVTNDEKVRPGEFEPMCNPVAQAMLLNKAGTELNVMVGLCVGHDTLFIKYSEAPVTVMAVKDRVLAHNPLGAVYATHYYQKKLAAHKLDDGR